jgi:hypothetical protein
MDRRWSFIRMVFLAVVFVMASGSAFADKEVLVAQNTNNRRPVKKYKPYVTPANPVDTRWASSHSPWDFSGLLGLYNPGFGVNVRGAYRILDSILEDVDDSLSIEVGVGYVGASNTYGGVSSSYSLIEFPILGRWDFRLNNTKFIVGGNTGFVYFAGSNVTVNGVSYNTNNGLYFVIGGQAMYELNKNWAVRADVDFGGYTILSVGVTYFL